jgi:predicted O-linked N-acetylglucosamine transferase (SPINDLY family)
MYLEKRLEIEKIRSCYKQLGIDALTREEYNEAIRFFNLWQYSYLNYLKIDRYEYDFDLLNLIEKHVSSLTSQLSDVPQFKNKEKIRIAYLVHGISSSSSILTKILLNIIKNHDTSHFEIHVFTTESFLKLLAYSGRVFINQFKELNCHIHFAPPYLRGFSKIMSITKKMCSFRPHILVTSAALADFEHFFISALKPAPIRIGFVFASPAQFIPPSFDYGISWINHIIFDCPIPCVNSGTTYLPEENPGKKYKKSDFGIPNDAMVLVSAGRYEKFQDRGFFEIVMDTMVELPNLHFMIIGVSQNQIPYLKDLSIDEINKRIHIFAWSTRYEDYLSIADIYLDTYPSGGGVTLYDAAMLHLPIISFSDDYSKKFDQSTWNPAEEIFPKDSIILINRHEVHDLKGAISRLYHDPDLRKDLGDAAYNATNETRIHIPENVRKIESLYYQVVNKLK